MPFDTFVQLGKPDRRQIFQSWLDSWWLMDRHAIPSRTDTVNIMIANLARLTLSVTRACWRQRLKCTFPKPQNGAPVSSLCGTCRHFNLCVVGREHHSNRGRRGTIKGTIALLRWWNQSRWSTVPSRRLLSPRRLWQGASHESKHEHEFVIFVEYMYTLWHKSCVGERQRVKKSMSMENSGWSQELNMITGSGVETTRNSQPSWKETKAATEEYDSLRLKLIWFVIQKVSIERRVRRATAPCGS